MVERFIRTWRRARPIAIPLSCIAGLCIFVAEVDPHYAVRKWLFWRYALYWLLAVAFTIACIGSGDVVVRKLTPRVGMRERIVTSLSAGLLIFFLGMFLGGLLGLYGALFFFALPLALCLAAGRPFYRSLFRYARRLLILRH